MNRIGKGKYEYVMKSTKHAPFFVPSLKFLSENGVPIDSKKQRAALLQVIALMVPFLIVALYLVFLLPALLVATFPLLVFMPAMLIVQFYRLRRCREIEDSLESE